MNKKQKILEIKTNKLVDSLFVGNFKTHFKGNGLEFADFREYNYGDDIKNIDWLTSEKEGKTLIRLYEEERELSIYFIIDTDENFDFEFDGKSKFDIIEELIYLIGFSSIKGGDKLGLFIYNSSKKDFLIARKGKSNFINIVNKSREYINKKTNKIIFSPRKKIISFFRKKGNLLNKNIKKNNISLFNSLKIKKSLVFLLTSRTEINDSNLKVLALKNDLIVCNIFHSFENTLYGKGIKGFDNLSGSIFLDASDKTKKERYINLRKEKITNFKKNIHRLGGRYLYLDENTTIYKEMFKLMKKES